MVGRHSYNIRQFSIWLWLVGLVWHDEDLFPQPVKFTIYGMHSCIATTTIGFLVLQSADETTVVLCFITVRVVKSNVVSWESPIHNVLLQAGANTPDNDPSALQLCAQSASKNRKYSTFFCMNLC